MGLVCHAFKKEVTMNGRNRILSARISSSQEVLILGQCHGRIPHLTVYEYSHQLQGLDLSNGQHINHNLMHQIIVLTI